MAEEYIQWGVDSSQIESGFEHVIKAVKKAGLEVVKLQKITREGIKYNNQYAVTYEVLTNKGNKWVQTLGKQKDKFQTLNKEIQKGIVTTNQRIIAQNKLNAQQRIFNQNMNKNIERMSMKMRMDKQAATISKNSQEANNQRVITENKLNTQQRMFNQNMTKGIERMRMKVRLDKQAATSTQSLQKATSKTTKETQNAVAAIQEWVKQARVFEKIVAFFLVRRALFFLQNQLRESISKLEEFHSAISEIRTISQESQGAIESWAASLMKVSNAFNQDIVDAANARYQILSNQITKGVIATERFAETAAIFSKVTRSTAEDGVNFLTAALNAYSMSASQAEEVAAVLFKTIELGRVRASDIADNFGRVTVVAAQMGISLEELSAMIDTITIQGVKATESITLLRGILMKLAKPTGDMKDLLAELGVSTGEQMIQTYGLAGTFKLLFERTRGTNSEIAKLFGRIRPTAGMSALINQLGTFESNLHKIENTAQSTYAEAKLMQYQTSGEKLAKTMNEVKNHFVTTFGYTAANLIINFSELFTRVKTGADGVKTEVAGLVTVIEKLSKYAIAGGGIWLLVKGFDLVKKAIMAANAEASVFRMHINLLSKHGRSLFMLVLSIAIAEFAGRVTKASAAMKNLRASIRNFRNEAARSKVESFEFFDFSNLDRSLEVTSKRAAELRKVYEPALEKLEGRIESLTEKEEDLIDQTGDGVKRFVKSINSLVKKAEEGIKDLGKEIETIADALEEFIQDSKNLRTELAEKLLNEEEIYQKRIKQASEAKTKFFQAAEEGNYETAKKYGEKYRELVDEITDYEIEQKENAVERITDLNKDIAKQNEKINKEIAKQSDVEEPDYARVNKERQELRELERKRATLTGVRDKFDPKATVESISNVLKEMETTFEAVTKDKIINTIEAAEATYNNIVDNVKGMIEQITGEVPEKLQSALDDIDFKNLRKNLTDTIAGPESMRELSENLFVDPIANLIDAKSVDELRELMLPADFQQTLSDLTEIQAKIITNKEQLEKTKTEYEAIVKAQQKLMDMQDERAVTEEDIKNSIKETFDENLANAEKLARTLRMMQESVAIEAPSMQRTMGATQMTEGLWSETMLTPFEAILKKGTISKLIDSLEEYQEASSVKDQIKQQDELNKLYKQFSKDMVEAKKQIETMDDYADTEIKEDALTNIKQLDSYLKVLLKGNKDLTNQVEQAPSKLENLYNELDADYDKMINNNLILKNTTGEIAVEIGRVINTSDNLKESIDNIPNAMKNIAGILHDEFSDLNSILQSTINKINRLNSAGGTSSVKTENKQLGGPVYAQGGMLAKGTDTIPAMLTPGEFVVNKEATQQMLGRLIPMNYGHQDLPSNNTNNSVNVGDIQVTVKGGSTGRATAEEIAYTLKDAMRRGVLR